MRRCLRHLTVLFVALGFLGCGTLHGWALLDQDSPHADGAAPAHHAADHAHHSDPRPEAPPPPAADCGIMQCLWLLVPPPDLPAQRITLTAASALPPRDVLSGCPVKPDLPPPRISA